MFIGLTDHLIARRDSRLVRAGPAAISHVTKQPTPAGAFVDRCCGGE
jgi:hypothetical protein